MRRPKEGFSERYIAGKLRRLCWNFDATKTAESPRENRVTRDRTLFYFLRSLPQVEATSIAVGGQSLPALFCNSVLHFLFFYIIVTARK